MPCWCMATTMCTLHVVAARLPIKYAYTYKSKSPPCYKVVRALRHLVHKSQTYRFWPSDHRPSRECDFLVCRCHCLPSASSQWSGSMIFVCVWRCSLNNKSHSFHASAPICSIAITTRYVASRALYVVCLRGVSLQSDLACTISTWHSHLTGGKSVSGDTG